MASPSQNFTPTVYHAGPSGPPAFDRVEAAGVVAGAVAVFVVVGASLPAGLGALACAQIVGLVGVPVFAAALMRRPLRGLGLGRPRALPLVGAGLFGLAFWYVNLRGWQPLLAQLDQRELPALERFLASPSWLLRLGAVALAPALCEELLMRGVLARSLASSRDGDTTGARLAIAVVVSAAVFAAFHLSPLRLGPTFTLGVPLALFTLRAGCIWPAVLAHAINNAVALVIADGAVPALGDAIAAHPDAALAIAAVASGGGIVLAVRTPAS